MSRRRSRRVMVVAEIAAGELIDSQGNTVNVSRWIIDSTGSKVSLDPDLIDSTGTEHNIY